MFFSLVENEWGEMLFMPTEKGEALLTVGIALLLFLAMVAIQIHGGRVSAKKLAVCAITIGIASLLSNIKLVTLPTGGTITLFSMLAIALPAYWYGFGAGVMTGMAYGVFQMLIDPYLVSPAQVAVDYFFAFGAMGIAGLLSESKHGLIKGYIAGVLGRYFFAVLSGWLFFGSYATEGWHPLVYSLVYNGVYIFAEAVITLIPLFLPPVQRVMSKIKQYAGKTETYAAVF